MKCIGQRHQISFWVVLQERLTVPSVVVLTALKCQGKRPSCTYINGDLLLTAGPLLLGNCRHPGRLVANGTTAINPAGSG